MSSGALSPAEWERRLVVHYLRSDGAAGGAPLFFLDATPAELAIASGIEGIGDLEAQQAFIAHFNQSNIEAWLSGEFRPPLRDAENPTYFRYLVLTCLVSATEAGAGSTKNFRIRLGELLGTDSPFNSVDGVNELWRALVDWCDRKRAAGEPFRRIVLPHPGHATLIGCAVRIAFPSWGDRSSLTQILRRLSPAIRRNPERLVQELARPNHSHLMPSAVAAALSDFAASIRARRRMLLGHRFWRLVQSIDARLLAEDPDARRERWRLDGRFGGYEQDEVAVALFRSRGSIGDEPAWRGSIQQLAELNPSSLPMELAEGLRQGVLMLTEAPGAVWSMHEGELAEDSVVVLLARTESLAIKWALNTSWRPLEGSWLVSGKLEPLSLTELRRRLGLAPATGIRLIDLTFGGGVKTGRSTWLGRPSILPTVNAVQGCTLTLDNLGTVKGSLSLAGRGPSWELVAHEPVAGRWQVRAVESKIETDKIFCLEDEVPERRDFPVEDSTFESERDLLIANRAHAGTLSTGLLKTEPVESILWDILEAVYAGPKSGWAENELVEILQPVLPNPHFVWDFLRSLAEAEWLEPLVSKSWRARKWRLRKPYLEAVATNLAIVRGAVGAAARRRLNEAAVAGSADVIVRAGVSVWAPPMLIARGDVEALSADLGWGVQQYERPRVRSAPNCWPPEPRSGKGRLLGGIWKFDVGLFLPADKVGPQEGAVRLERLVRDRGDDRDIYRVTANEDTFLTSSRTVAILEAHRRRRDPLFELVSDRFVRRSRSGHLPTAIARALAIRCLRASGPALRPDGSWTYLYPSDAETALWVARIFGSAIAIFGERRRKPFFEHVVEQRRLGRRPSWYQARN
ncbi:hypothetical protein [Bradyrhizobium diazoefficiens]|uniref:hypothetical protein n=1 Tax=Bradyrhizobium diazoefficiens TaxID=1355477 RepID=UPI001177D763|nr:hypothetical protein [Bradyrhizobium diazoefficiens]